MRASHAPPTTPTRRQPQQSGQKSSEIPVIGGLHLTIALNDPTLKAEATGLLRGLIGEVRLVPNEEGLAIELVGELATILALGEAKTPRKGTSAGSITLVAGVGFEPTTFRLWA